MAAHRNHWTCSCGDAGEYQAEGSAHARVNPGHIVAFSMLRLRERRAKRERKRLAKNRQVQDARDLRAASGRCRGCGVNQPFEGRVRCLPCLFGDSRRKQDSRAARRSAEAAFIEAHDGLLEQGEIEVLPGVNARLGKLIQGGHHYGIEVIDADAGERLGVIPLRRLMAGAQPPSQAQ